MQGLSSLGSSGMVMPGILNQMPAPLMMGNNMGISVGAPLPSPPGGAMGNPLLGLGMQMGMPFGPFGAGFGGFPGFPGLGANLGGRSLGPGMPQGLLPGFGLPPGFAGLNPAMAHAMASAMSSAVPSAMSSGMNPNFAQFASNLPASMGASMPMAPPSAPRPMPVMAAPIKPVPGPARRHTGAYKSREFVFTSHHDGNGIIFFMGLNRKEGKWYNPVDTRKLRVIASSLDSGTLPMTVDQEFNELLYASKDEYPSWVVFDFLECSVRPTYYSLAHKGILQSYMRSWKFEGSHDAATWDTLCIHTNDVSLSKQNTVASWAVKTHMAYRYLRILLEQGGNSEAGSALLFNAFEVYGDFRIPTNV